MNNKSLFIFLIIIFCSLETAIAKAEPADFEINLQQARSYGYTLGDEVQLTVLIKTPLFSKLERNQLPDPGFVNGWLNLKSIKVSNDIGDYDYQLKITYQLFKGVNQNRQLTIPAMPLKFKQGVGFKEINVPEFPFSYHPVSTVTGDDQLSVQPELTAPAIDTNQRRLSYALLAIALLLLYIGWFYGKVPFLERYSGKFGTACKVLSKLKKQPFDENVYRQALQCFHQAINAVNGATLFQHQLPDFFVEHARYQPLQKQTETLFKMSRHLFFTEKTINQDSMSLTEIECLCRQYRKLERGGKWV